MVNVGGKFLREDKHSVISMLCQMYLHKGIKSKAINFKTLKRKIGWRKVEFVDGDVPSAPVGSSHRPSSPDHYILMWNLQKPAPSYCSW